METVDSGEYNVYSTFQSHEPDFDYLKSLEIEEKINKIRWLPQQNAAHFLLSTNGETPVTPVDQLEISVKDAVQLTSTKIIKHYFGVSTANVNCNTNWFLVF